MAVIEHGFQPSPQIREGNTQKPNPDYSDMTKLGSGIYRSEDGGASWNYMNRMNNRPFYYFVLWRQHPVKPPFCSIYLEMLTERAFLATLPF